MGAGGGLVGLGYVLSAVVGDPLGGQRSGLVGAADAGTTRAMTSMDMSDYMDMFVRHGEIGRTVEDIAGGVRTATEADSPDLIARLQGHVAAMYENLDEGVEVTCMSASLPTLFRRAGDYQRTVTFTAKGIVVTETSDDTEVTEAIRAHAREVSGFVAEGMPAMMRQMMGHGPTR